ncbi:MAG: polysaccharide biosynthesis C-terminal domain-containing protein, partial [Acidobacteria bacterium]|nr:polysaccharide biosynthesis C-terminal domain-containing protein [Acidobacteriota bacterium]
GMLLGRRMLEFLFGPEYAAAATALRILMWSLPLMALRSVFRIILVSYNLQRLDLRAIAVGAFTNIALDLALVPGLSTVGAAISTLSSELVIFFLSYRYVWRRVERLGILRHMVRPLGASILLLAAGAALASTPLLVQAAVAGTVYLAALFALRGLTWKEIEGLYRG